ncbi:MAG: hypothetical protein R3C19_07710 [Planctomycetaceae bacterium]
MQIDLRAGWLEVLSSGGFSPLNSNLVRSLEAWRITSRARVDPKRWKNIPRYDTPIGDDDAGRN